MDNFICKQCGHCCINLSDAFSTCVSEEDIMLWESKGRHDILEWVDVIPLGEDEAVYDVWLDPETGEDVEQCPWLVKPAGGNKYICRIHDVKPAHCREYPHSKKHAEETGCVGFEGSGSDKQSYLEFTLLELRSDGTQRINSARRKTNFSAVIPAFFKML